MKNRAAHRFVIQWVINGTKVYWAGKTGTHRRAWHVLPTEAVRFTEREAVDLSVKLLEHNCHYDGYAFQLVNLDNLECNL